MEKHTRKAIVDEIMLRKNYVEIIYSEMLTKFRDIIVNGPIWVLVHDTFMKTSQFTTDVDGRYITIAIIPFKQFHINCGKLNKCNHQTINCKKC